MDTPIQENETPSDFNTNENLLALCPNCFCYPYLTLSKTKLKEIFIYCDNCKLSQFIGIHKYINDIKNKTPQESSNKCIEHNQQYTNYCFNCKTHFCDQCNFEKHIQHKTTPLKGILITTELKDKIIKGYNHITGYCSDLKLSVINRLNTDIKQIENSYQIFLSTNRDILLFMALLIDNYSKNKNNYYLKTNLMRIKDINITQLNDTINKENIIKYFNEYCFLSDDNFYSVTIKKIKETKIIKEHTDGVTCIILLSDGRLASSSKDKTIKIYNINNSYQCDMTLEGHTNYIDYISEITNKKIASCSHDLSIRFWTIKEYSYTCDYCIFQSHSSPLKQLISLSEGRFASCSADKLIKIWSITPPYKLIKTLKGHFDTVNTMLQLKRKSTFISGALDLIIWDLKTYKCDKVISNIECKSLLELANETIIVGGCEAITVLSTTTYEIIQKIACCMPYLISLMELRDGKILCGSEEGSFCVCDIESKDIYIKFMAHHKCIFSLLYLNDNQFISCSDDCTIKVWDY